MLGCALTFSRVVIATSYSVSWVSRRSMRISPSLPATTISERFLPLTVPVSSGLTWLRSQSCTSAGPNCLYQPSLPVRTSSATTEFRVEVVAGAHVGVEVRRRVGHREIEQTLLGIEGQRRPERAAAMFARLAVRPGLGTWLVIVRNEVEAPHRLACLQVEGADPALRSQSPPAGP